MDNKIKSPIKKEELDIAVRRYRNKHTVVTKGFKAGMITACSLLGAGVVTLGTLYGVSFINRKGDGEVKDSIIIDTSKKDDVEIKKIEYTTKDTLEIVAITVSCKSKTKEVESIKLKKGNVDLVEGVDYGFIEENQCVEILKSSMDKNKGQLVITPVLKDKEAEGEVLNIWTFTDEFRDIAKEEGIINERDGKYYFKDKEVVFNLTPTDQFPYKLDAYLAAGIPSNPNDRIDIFLGEDAFTYKYQDSPYTLELDNTIIPDYEDITKNMYKYVLESGQIKKGDKYVQKSFDWGFAPVAMFYRRSLAKEYLGTDDPGEVQKYFETTDKLIESTGMLKVKSNGKCRVVAGVDDLYKPLTEFSSISYLNDESKLDSLKKQPYDDYMDIAKTFKDKEYTGNTKQWAEAWFAGMKGTLKDEKGNPLEVFSYFLPVWGLEYVLKTNAPETSGDWAMIPGPTQSFWGGSSVFVCNQTDNKNTVGQFISEFFDTKNVVKFINKCGPFSFGGLANNIEANKAIMDTVSDDFLGGQNPLKVFDEVTNSFKEEYHGAYSRKNKYDGGNPGVQSFYTEAVTAYISGEKSKDTAIADFLNQSWDLFPEIDPKKV